MKTLNVGIASIEDMEKRTMAIARGHLATGTCSEVTSALVALLSERCPASELNQRRHPTLYLGLADHKFGFRN